MIPTDGWVFESLDAPLVPFPLPEPYTFVYRDSGFHGVPNAVTARLRGAATVELDARPKSLTITIQLHDAYDVALVDRIA